MCVRTDGAGCAETPWPLLVTNTAPPWRPLCLMYLSKIFRSPASISITLVLLLQRTVACPAFTASTVIYCLFHSISLLLLCFVICSSLTSCAAALLLLRLRLRPDLLSPRSAFAPYRGRGYAAHVFPQNSLFLRKDSLAKENFCACPGTRKASAAAKRSSRGSCFLL